MKPTEYETIFRTSQLDISAVLQPRRVNSLTVIVLLDNTETLMFRL